MTQLDIPTAAVRLADLVARAVAGEDVVIADAAGRPVARLVPVADNPRRSVHGMYEGQIWMSDDFTAPLTDDELKVWDL
jgi:prevent-host-death family protein